MEGAEIKKCTEYVCEKCDYTCLKKFNWDRHCETAKHLGNFWKQENEPKKETFQCELCKKEYQTSAGLWKHKKVCKKGGRDEEKGGNDVITKELVISLLKQNHELQTALIEALKQSSSQNAAQSNNKYKVRY
jgi:hypothetical protein